MVPDVELESTIRKVAFTKIKKDLTVLLLRMVIHLPFLHIRMLNVEVLVQGIHELQIFPVGRWQVGPHLLGRRPPSVVWRRSAIYITIL